MQKGTRSFDHKNIEITDALFCHYVGLVADKVLPHQWELLNDRVPGAMPSYCLKNFEIAAGRKQGEHRGVVFQDSDVYKWLEAVSYVIASGRGEKFLPLTSEVIELLATAQQPDGYLNTYYTIKHPGKRFTNLMEGHELYCAGHLIEAAVAYHAATGDRQLLGIACRFADLICKTFGSGAEQLCGIPGHSEIELALVKLYRVTGERRYLEAADFFVRQRGREPQFLIDQHSAQSESIFPEFSDYSPVYSQCHMPAAEQKSAEGHAVRAMYLYCAMADLALEEGDEALAGACRTLWESVTQKRMYITGGLGSSGILERFTIDYDLPNDCNYCETCACAGLIMFSQRMASLTGEARYYDALERALCNNLLSGISAKGDRYFYVNPLEVQPERCLDHTAMAHVKPTRQEWFSVACCPTNIARTLASLGQYIYARDESTVYINQLISSRLDEGVKIEICATLPADEVKITAEGSTTLKVRIPWYAEAPECRVNGRPFELKTERGYAVFELCGKMTIELSLHVKPRWVSANAEVRADSGRAAIMYGGFVYCLEEQDNGANLAECAVYPGAVLTPAASREGLPGELPALRYDGFRIKSRVTGLYGAPDFETRDCPLFAVPYSLWCNGKPGEMLVWQRLRL